MLILVITTPVVFFGNSRDKISFLFKSLTEIFKSSIWIKFFESDRVSFSAKNSFVDSNLPNTMVFMIVLLFHQILILKL